MLTVGLVFIVQTLSFMNCSCNFICGLSDVITKTFSQSVSLAGKVMRSVVSDRPFTLDLFNQLTFDVDFLRVYGS